MEHSNSQQRPRVSVYEEHAERLEELGLSLGEERGRLAMGLDLLTEALVVAGAHAVYCRDTMQASKPSHDMRAIVGRVEQVKELIQDVMARLARAPHDPR